MTDLHTDGNAVAGLLGEILAGDPAAIRRICASCGAEAELGAHRAYTGAGVVLRCPACDDVALRVGVAAERVVFTCRGTFTTARLG